MDRTQFAVISLHWPIEYWLTRGMPTSEKTDVTARTVTQKKAAKAAKKV